MKRNLKTVLVLVLVLLLLCGAEFLLSNRLRLSLRDTEPTELDLAEATVTKATKTAVGVHLNKGSKLTFSGLSLPVSCVKLKTENEKTSVKMIKISASDEGNKKSVRTSVQMRMYADEDAVCELVSAGELRTLTIECTEGSTFLLTSVVLNDPPAFRFNFLRVLLVYAIFLALYYAWKRKWWRVLFDEKNAKHNTVLYVSLLVTALIVVPASNGQLLKPYPLTEADPNAYEQLFTSFLNGKTELDLDFDDSVFDTLENPYDYTERNTVTERLGPFWDRAYYNGNFYCYFGIAPVLTVYFPIYFLTFGHFIPSAGLASMILLCGALLGLLLLLNALIVRFRLRVPALLLFFAMPTVALVGLLPMVGVCADMYYLAFASGFCFLTLSLGLGVAAVVNPKKASRISEFVFSGLCLALTLASRPTMALYGLLLVPVFVGVLLEKERTPKQKCTDALSFVIPLVLGGVAIMCYNYLRFDSFFEFGTTYQLTMSDVSYNKLRLGLLAEAFFHYFLQPPAYSALFPYFTPSYVSLASYGSYLYNTSTVGAFAFPVVLAGFGSGATSGKDRIKKATWLLCFLLPFGIAFADFCVGGVNLRYMADIMLPLALVGTLVLLELGGKMMECVRSEKASFCVFLLLVGIFTVSCLFGFALIFANERNWVLSTNPAVFRFFEKLFTF